MQLDTLKAKKRLVDEYGLPERHAEGIVELFVSAETRAATKQEMDERFEELREEMDERFEELHEEMDRRFEELREEMDRRFEQMEARFDRKLETTIADLERRLTVRIFAASGAVAAIIAVLNYVMG